MVGQVVVTMVRDDGTDGWAGDDDGCQVGGMVRRWVVRDGRVGAMGRPGTMGDGRRVGGTMGAMGWAWVVVRWAMGDGRWVMMSGMGDGWWRAIGGRVGGGIRTGMVRWVGGGGRVTGGRWVVGDGGGRGCG